MKKRDDYIKQYMDQVGALCRSHGLTFEKNSVTYTLALANAEATYDMLNSFASQSVTQQDVEDVLSGFAEGLGGYRITAVKAGDKPTPKRKRMKRRFKR